MITNIQNKLLLVIAARYPYPILIITGLFERVNSIDKTILVIENAMRNNISLFESIQYLEQCAKS